MLDPDDGSVKAHYEYDPYGDDLVASGEEAGANTFRFSSKYRDEAGLVYYGHRYHSSGLGRFVSRDPMAPGAEMLAYQFARNTPCNAVDLLGLVGVLSSLSTRLNVQVTRWRGRPVGTPIPIDAEVQVGLTVPAFGASPFETWILRTVVTLDRRPADKGNWNLAVTGSHPGIADIPYAHGWYYPNWLQAMLLPIAGDMIDDGAMVVAGTHRYAPSASPNWAWNLGEWYVP
jgi:RHS repeat-associated protein